MRGQGFLLPAVLLLSTLLLIMGLALLTSKSYQRRQLNESQLAAQALELSRAGLEDGRVKLLKDPRFPPPSIWGHSSFSYSQALTHSSGRQVGVFRVEADWSYDQAPYEVLTLRSTGLLGEDALTPVATRTVQADFQMTPSGWYLVRYEEY